MEKEFLKTTYSCCLNSCPRPTNEWYKAFIKKIKKEKDIIIDISKEPHREWQYNTIYKKRIVQEDSQRV